MPWIYVDHDGSGIMINPDNVASISESGTGDKREIHIMFTGIAPGYSPLLSLPFDSEIWDEWADRFLNG
jgi:hypothetical protein